METQFRITYFPAEYIPFISSDVLQRAIILLPFSRLAQQTEKCLWQFIKRHALQSSIHKGEAHFTNTQTSQPVTLQQILEEHPPDIQIHIRFSDLPLPAFLQQLDTIKQEYTSALQHLQVATKEAINERLIRDFTCTSNALEGTTHDMEEVSRVIDSPIPVEDEADLEILGHYNGVKILLSHQGEITDGLLFNLHCSLNLASLPPYKIGRYP